MRRTKIVCTMGPNTNSRDLMKKLIETGMDVARFNFSHGDHDEQKMRMDMLKELRKELKTPVAILLDTKGPEIRTGVLKDGKKVNLVTGQTFTLTTDEIMGDAKRVSITYKNLPEDVKPGDRILIDDGLIGLRVEKVNAPEIVCTVVNGGERIGQSHLGTVILLKCTAAEISAALVQYDAVRYVRQFDLLPFFVLYFAETQVGVVDHGKDILEL